MKSRIGRGSIAAFLILVVCLAMAAVAFSGAAAGAAEKTDVVIVGSGLAGLVAAYELEKLGVSVHILESMNRFGGRVATMDYGNGLVSEYGMHEIWAANPLLDYVKEFGLELSSAEEPYSSAIINGKYYPYVQENLEEYLKTVFTPDEIKEYYRWKKETGKIFDEAEKGDLTPGLTSLQDISFKKWIGNLKLPDKVAEFVRLTLECEIATDWDNVSALYGVLELRQFLHSTEQCKHCHLGNRALVNAFIGKIKGPKTLNARVARIVRKENPDGTFNCTTYFIKNEKLESISSSYVVMATASNYIHAIQMEPTLSTEQWGALKDLNMTPGIYSVVHFLIDKKANELFKVNGRLPFPVISRGTLGVIYGVLEEPPASQQDEVFTLLVHGDYARFYLESQDSLREKFKAELEKYWPGFSKYVKAAYFFGYHPGATPSWPVGRSPLDAKSKSLQKPVAGLYLAGDFVYTSHADGSVISGRNAAKAIGKSMKKM